MSDPIAKAQRDAKLAAALRANLRRRKAAKPPPATSAKIEDDEAVSNPGKPR